MDMLKAFGLGAVLTATIAVVVGSQGSGGGALDVHAMMISDQKIYWSWPLFLGGSGLAWGMMLLQK